MSETMLMPALKAASPKSEIALSPAQRSAYERIVEAIGVNTIVVLEAKPGFGKTKLVERLLRDFSGVRIGSREYLAATANSPHAGIEVQIVRLLERAMEDHDLIVIEDFDIPVGTFVSRQYARWQMGQLSMHGVVDRARAQGKRLLFTGANFRREYAVESFSFSVFDERMMGIRTQPFTADDYAFFLALDLDNEVVETIAIKRVFDHAPGMNGHQLRQLGALLRQHGRVDETFVREMIDTRILHANSDLGEIAEISFSDLKGFESIVEELTTYVLNPLQADPRIESIGLTPKRGVLLYGPPGTGKTSIGRALAHQMQGKFFMIDGTIPTEPAKTFYPRVEAVFNAAKKAAPCVLFIDDADVLFQSDRSTGLSRYLLTMLDGLESESAGKVAVIMTAMNPNHMPPALLRSGRVELWIETRPPSGSVRAEMIAADVATLPANFRDYNFDKIAEQTEGFNAADMRRIVSDVKALYARDVVEGRDVKPVDDYFSIAAGGVRHNKVLLGLAERGKLALGMEMSPEPISSSQGRSEVERKASRLRDEANSCGGE